MGREFGDLSGDVIAAAIEVHTRLGPGFVEAVCHQALKIELEKRRIPFESQKEVLVKYDGRVVGKHMLDLFVGGELVVELKAVAGVERVHYAQVKSYLRATGTNVGLILNFAAAPLEVKRVVLHYEVAKEPTED